MQVYRWEIRASWAVTKIMVIWSKKVWLRNFRCERHITKKRKERRTERKRKEKKIKKRKERNRKEQKRNDTLLVAGAGFGSLARNAWSNHVRIVRVTINNVSMRFAVLCRCVTGCFALQGLLHAVSEWMFHVGQSRWIVIVLLGVLASRSGHWHCSRRFMRFLWKIWVTLLSCCCCFCCCWTDGKSAARWWGQ